MRKMREMREKEIYKNGYSDGYDRAMKDVQSLLEPLFGEERESYLTILLDYDNYEGTD